MERALNKAWRRARMALACPASFGRCGREPRRAALIYDVLLGLHIIAVIAWMAGLLYLPRLFAYHTRAEAGSQMDETFKVMEAKLHGDDHEPSDDRRAGPGRGAGLVRRHPAGLGLGIPR